MSALRSTASSLDLKATDLREVNRALRRASAGEAFDVLNPGGLHSIAAGLRPRSPSTCRVMPATTAPG